VHPPDRCGAQRSASSANGDSGVEAVEVMSLQIEQLHVAEVRNQVALGEVAIVRHRGRLQRVLPSQPSLQVLADGQLVRADVTLMQPDPFVECGLGSRLRRETRLRGLDSLTAAGAQLVEHVGPGTSASMRQVRPFLVARATLEVTLVDGSVFHRETPTSSRSGAVGMRIRRPRWRTGVGQRSVRISS